MLLAMNPLLRDSGLGRALQSVSQNLLKSLKRRFFAVKSVLKRAVFGTEFTI